MPPRFTRSLADRWQDQFTEADGCWMWTGPVGPDGYGWITRGSPLKGSVGAHRVAWEVHRGPIPDDLTIDHLCRVRLCVNPAHLEPVPRGVNSLRGNSVPSIHARQTECIHGHPFDEANTYRYPSGKRRGCRACAREWQSRFRARHR